MTRIVVVGSANVDQVVQVDHRPLGGETILGSDLSFTPGGKGANQAVASARLDGDVTFVGAVGNDSVAALLRESLSSAGVNLQALAEVAAPTGVAIIILTPDGENSIIVAPGANRHVGPDALDPGLVSSAEVVVAQLEIPLETVLRAAELTRGRFILNAAPPRELPPSLIMACDPLVVNESEAAFLLGRAGADLPEEDLASALLALGAASVVVTLGERGCYVAEATGQPVHVPAVAVPAVVDTTGAGDAFVGALAVRLAEGDPLPRAASFATRVAAYAVAHRGAQASYPRHTDLA